MYVRTSFRGAKTCKIGKRVFFFEGSYCQIFEWTGQIN